MKEMDEKVTTVTTDITNDGRELCSSVTQEIFGFQKMNVYFTSHIQV